MIYWSIFCNLFQVVHTFCYAKERYNLLFILDVAYCLYVTIYSMKYHRNYYNSSNSNMHSHHILLKYYIGDPNHTFDCILNLKWIHYYTFVSYILMKPTFLCDSYNRNMYDTMILLHIRTNYYYC